LRFFATLCQALNIPFFTEDSNNKIKKCGLRNPDYIKKLTILKDLTENHYVNEISSIINNFLNYSYY